MFSQRLSSVLLISVAFADTYIDANCLNDHDFRQYGVEKRSCSWIRNEEERRQKACLHEDVMSSCPQSCGECCENDPSYTFVDDMGEIKTCEWIGLKLKRQKNYCEQWKSGGMVRNYCPLACGQCKEPINKGPCQDNEYFRYRDQAQKSCEWIGRLSSRRENACVIEKVMVNCPRSCRTCCEDDPYFLLLADNDIERKCTWLSDNEVRQERYCKSLNGGVLVENKCPVSCGICTPNESPEPLVISESPSIAPSSFSSSFFPSGIFSERPTGTPSSFPSMTPTDLTSPIVSPPSVRDPSMVPNISSFPSANQSVSTSPSAVVSLSIKPSFAPSFSSSTSALPSMEPSTQPSNAPSSMPSIVLSSNPSSSASALPSIKLSSMPSLSPVIVTTSSPTVSPSTAPSTKPSRIPSNKPSVSPSSDHSMSPSPLPSKKPSLTPSTQPSRKTSSLPSGSPSSGISSTPSSIPSLIEYSSSPSSLPSKKPSLTPSTQPSQKTSSLPSGPPSSGISSTPSNIPSLIEVLTEGPTVTPSESELPSPSSSRPTTKLSSTPSISPSTSLSTSSSIPTKSQSLSPSITAECKIDAVLSFPSLEDAYEGYHNDEMSVTREGSDEECSIINQTRAWCEHSGEDGLIHNDPYYQRYYSRSESVMFNAEPGILYTLRVDHKFTNTAPFYEVYYHKDHLMAGTVKIEANGEVIGDGFTRDVYEDVDTFLGFDSAKGEYIINPAYDALLEVSVMCFEGCVCVIEQTA